MPWQRSGSGGSYAGSSAGTGSKLKQKLIRFKEGAVEAKDLAVEALKHNAGRAVVAGIVAAIGLGIYGHGPEHKRSLESEIVFSERSQMIRDAEAAGQKIDPLTDHYAITNDMLMKVLEARNLSTVNSHSGSEGERFARELQIKMELDRHTLTLPKIFNGMMDESLRGARQELTPISSTRNNLATVNPRLDGAWSHRSRDNYHTEHY